MQAKLYRSLAILYLLGAGGPTAASIEASFLDHPADAKLLLPPPKGTDEEGPETHIIRLAKMRAATGKPIILPDGLENFLKQKDGEENWGKGKVLFLMEGSWSSYPDKARLRDYLDHGFGNLGLTWQYDAKKDAIVSDFAWRRDDPRGAVELLNLLASTHPLPREFGPKAIDPWQVAFDALLSKPENLAHAWPVRFCADQRKMFVTGTADNLVAGKTKDSAGKEHYLIVNNQTEMCNPGPEGSFSFYLFDLQGMLEEGGVETIGYRCFNDSAWLEADGHHLDMRTWNNGRERRDIIFSVADGHLVRNESLDEGVAPVGWRLQGFDSGERLYTSSK